MPCNPVTGGRGPFFGSEVSGEVIVDAGRIGYSHGGLLRLFEAQGLERLENAFSLANL